MKILVVTPTFLPIIGGAELGIYELCKRLGGNNKVRILTPSHPDKIISKQGARDTYFSGNNFEVCHFRDIFNFTKIKGQKILGRLIPPASVSYIWTVFKQIKVFSPDVINFHYIVPGGLALILLKKLTKIPVVLSLIGRTDVLRDSNQYFKKHQKYFINVLKSANCVISISRYILGPYFKQIPFKIIPYGVDTKRFSPKVDGRRTKNSLGIGKNKVILFALQRLEKVKKVDILIRSLKYIIETNQDVFLVIGGKGREEQSLKTLARKLGVYNNVIFTGYIPERDLPKYFAMSDVFIFSSPNETFGIVVAQAMSSGKPIVAVNSTSIPEVVDNNVNGILVKPLSAKKLAIDVIKVLNNRNILEKYSINSREKAVAEYDWDNIAWQYNQIFSKLIKEDIKS